MRMVWRSALFWSIFAFIEFNCPCEASILLAITPTSRLIIPITSSFWFASSLFLVCASSSTFMFVLSCSFLANRRASVLSAISSLFSAALSESLQRLTLPVTSIFQNTVKIGFELCLWNLWNSAHSHYPGLFQRPTDSQYDRSDRWISIFPFRALGAIWNVDNIISNM